MLDGSGGGVCVPSLPSMELPLVVNITRKDCNQLSLEIGGSFK